MRKGMLVQSNCVPEALDAEAQVVNSIVSWPSLSRSQSQLGGGGASFGVV